MTTTTEETIRALSDSELETFARIAQEECAIRAKQREEATKAKIRELARAEGFSVSIGSTRGKSSRSRSRSAARSKKARDGQ